LNVVERLVKAVERGVGLAPLGHYVTADEPVDLVTRQAGNGTAPATGTSSLSFSFHSRKLMLMLDQVKARARARARARAKALRRRRRARVKARAKAQVLQQTAPPLRRARWVLGLRSYRAPRPTVLLVPLVCPASFAETR
jgi:hypothetical protein